VIPKIKAAKVRVGGGVLGPEVMSGTGTVPAAERQHFGNHLLAALQQKVLTQISEDARGCTQMEPD
jgi:hypothetical protein